MSARHISSPSELRQRLAERDSSPGGCRKPGIQCRLQVKDLWRPDNSPKASPDKRVALQCLGEMPWVSRATAIKPDLPEVGPTMPNVKGANVRLRGVKRTCLLALHMSAFDPKRTLAVLKD